MSLDGLVTVDVPQLVLAEVVVGGLEWNLPKHPLGVDALVVLTLVLLVQHGNPLPQHLLTRSLQTRREYQLVVYLHLLQLVRMHSRCLLHVVG